MTLVISGVQLLVTLNLWNDFSFKEDRLQFRVDRDAKTHATLYLSARNYLKLGMWGLAALHLRRAIAREPHKPTYHLSLALAYHHLNRPTQAAQALAQAEHLDPNAPEIEQLRKAMAQGSRGAGVR
jgi:Tfp pilus assembly protein PilF